MLYVVNNTIFIHSALKAAQAKLKQAATAQQQEVSVQLSWLLS